jgi:hypothetical protein
VEELPRHHIARTPLPWRPEERLTECGRPADELRHVWTRDEAVRNFRSMGQQRFALLVCMTCKDTASRWHTWEEDPVDRLRREVNRPGASLEYELRAIDLLIRQHHDEFVETVAALEKTSDLRSHRKRNRMRLL